MSPGSSSHSWDGTKPSSIFSGTSGRSVGPPHLADPPASAAGDLQQEDVVRIDVRADAATVARIGEHRIVEPRIGHEAKSLEQAMRADVVQIDALHEQGPAGAALRRQGTFRGMGPCRTVQRSPWSTTRRDSTSSRAASENSVAASMCGNASGHRGAHQQRLLLPVPAHESLRPRVRRAERWRFRLPWVIVR